VEKGYYGKLYMVNYKKDGRLYGLKCLSKNRLAHVKDFSMYCELSDLDVIDCPFIVKNYFAFQNESKIFLLSELCQGGDFGYYLKLNKKRLNHETIQFYFAQLVMAIDYLHKKNIAYKDLKWENIYLDNEGYLKLNNFCLSNDILELKSFTQAGNEYLAPEIIIGESYGRGLDMWCLGVLLFQMYYSIVSVYLIT
jgi:serine/threonine protein kinase